jgi:hypothetical protein
MSTFRQSPSVTYDTAASDLAFATADLSQLEAAVEASCHLARVYIGRKP